MFQNPAPFSHLEEKAYRQRAKESHPDKGGDVEEFRALDIGIMQESFTHGCKSNYKAENSVRDYTLYYSFGPDFVPCIAIPLQRRGSFHPQF